MEKNKLAKLIDETMDSMDGAERATPAPFLLTRLHAALRREEVSYWERITVFLCRPGVAVAAVLLVLVLNFFMYTYSNSSQGRFQTIVSGADEYSMINPAALFDIENTQP
jgi:hypothetical protein